MSTSWQQERLTPYSALHITLQTTAQCSLLADLKVGLGIGGGHSKGPCDAVPTQGKVKTSGTQHGCDDHAGSWKLPTHRQLFLGT